MEINFLHTYAKKLNELNHEIMCLQKIVEVTANPQDVKCFLQALEEVKATVESLPLAE